MKGDQQVVGAVIIFFLGAVFGGLAKGTLIAPLFKDYVPALATLLAAFLGARYAFRLQSNKAERDIRNTNIVAGNLAIFNLLRMLNQLLNYQSQVIGPVRGKPESFLRMRPTLHFLESDIQIDIDSLAFLLHSDDPNLLGELALEKLRFQTAMAVINDRSRLHLEQVQPILERAGVVEGGTYTFEEIKAFLGARLFATIQQTTNQIVDHVDSTIVSLQETGAKLTATLRKLYPNERIIAFGATPNDSQRPNSLRSA